MARIPMTGGFQMMPEGEQVLKITHLEIDIGIKHAFKAFHFSDTHLNYFDAVDFAAVDKKKKNAPRNLKELGEFGFGAFGCLESVSAS